MGAARRRLATAVALLAVTACAGTVGYMVIEGWGLLDSVYMTVITIGSVGYGETHPLSREGRVFTIGLIVVGLASAGYAISTVTAFFVEGELTDFLGKRKMERRVAALENHVIVCGAGETGRHIARELASTATPFVFVEIERARVPAIEKLGDALYVIGDATESGTLEAARVQRARGLIVNMPSDKDNLFAILTARELNPSLRIVARVITEESRPKLLKAGADAAVSNNLIGGLRMASEMLRPHVVSFLDAMLRQPGAIRVQEIPVPPGPASGRTLRELNVAARVGVVVFGRRDADTGQYEFNPPAATRLKAGDVLIACADEAQFRALHDLVARG